MFELFVNAIKKSISKDQIIEDELLRYAYSTDASLYRMVPKLVVVIKKESEVLEIIKAANCFDVKLTFRAAGTSVSGQAVTDQILVMLAKDSWLKHTIIDNGAEIGLEPGIIGADANSYLKSFKRKIGPDPGSIHAAKIGGIVANNSSGMCCGTAKNSYATLKSIRAILADGSILDTGSKDLLSAFKANKKDLLSGIEEIRQKIIKDSELVSFIRKKFSIKNTSGYSLNAFLDFDDPIKILERLMVGSEGTLGFISNVNLLTVPDYDFKALNLIYGKLSDLVEITVKISGFDVSSVELLDAYTLQSVSGNTNFKKFLVDLPDDSYAAIMIEVESDSNKDLQEKISKINNVLKTTNVMHQLGFVSDEQTIETLWEARNGTFPCVAGQRPLGSSVLVEDVAVQIELLPDLINDMRGLLIQHGFGKAAIFGHVLSGNIHFVLTPNFANPNEVQAYDDFMHAFTQLVATKFNGSLKAEHGSGRNVSPFAVVEWGKKCWDLMWDIKALLDPKTLLNPDVKLTRDNTLHMQHLKQFPVVHDEINKCMECGFCEHVCPSRKLSLTPRQRNSVARKITTLEGSLKKDWEEKYQYLGIDTCATTGMCKTVCPVGINTGAFMIDLKPKKDVLVNHASDMSKANSMVKLGNFAASIVGNKTLQGMTKLGHGLIKQIPIYLDSMPKAQSYNFDNSEINNNNDLLLVPACPNRIFGADTDYGEYPSKLILEKFGYKVSFLSDTKTACCGQMYHSMCNTQQQKKMQTDLEKRLAGSKFAIIDNSSCSAFAKDAGIDTIDINQFIVEHVDKSKIKKNYKKIALHIDCSTAKHFFSDDYMDILRLCSDEVITPEGINCCGFAGDKGFNLPELNASSLSLLAGQIEGAELGVTFNRTCQIGLTHHGKVPYISFVELMLNCMAS